MPELNFVVPVVMLYTPISYAIVMCLHWELYAHRGNHAQQRALAQMVHIPQARAIINNIKRDCKRCRILIARTLDQTMGGLSPFRVMICPAFYAIQIDVMSPFVAHCIHGKRSQLKIYALVIVCITTGAVGIYALEKEDAASIVKAVIRHSCRHGYPSINFLDHGSGLMLAVKLQVILRDAEAQLNRKIIQKLFRPMEREVESK